jgi:hypothetical protein
LLDELIEPDLLHCPVDLAGFQPRQFEQVVDQRAERADVGGDQEQLLADAFRFEDPVFEAFGDQSERGDWCAQVVRDGCDELAASSFFGCDLCHHRLDVGGERRQLVPAADRDADVSGALCHFGERRADRVEVRQCAPRDEPPRADSEQSGITGRQGHEERVHVGDEHEMGEQRNGRAE